MAAFINRNSPNLEMNNPRTLLSFCVNWFTQFFNMIIVSTGCNLELSIESNIYHSFVIDADCR